VIKQSQVLALWPGNDVELGLQSGLTQSALPGLRMQVERTALDARGAGVFAFVDDGVDAMHLKDSGERESP